MLESKSFESSTINYSLSIVVFLVKFKKSSLFEEKWLGKNLEQETSSFSMTPRILNALATSSEQKNVLSSDNNASFYYP